jgi:uncharacterized protein (DUF2252 family)
MVEELYNNLVDADGTSVPASEFHAASTEAKLVILGSTSKHHTARLSATKGDVEQVAAISQIILASDDEARFWTNRDDQVQNTRFAFSNVSSVSAPSTQGTKQQPGKLPFIS